MELIQQKIIEYGMEVDRLSIAGDCHGLQGILDEMKQFINSNVDAKKDAAIFYFLGTGYGTYSNFLVNTGKKHIDSDVVGTRRWAMYYYRKAWVLFQESSQTEKRLGLRILTNYANVLDEAGRVIEALRIYRNALCINESFSMARGNYGRALKFLANIVNDEGHYEDLHCYAYQTIKRAISVKDYDLHDQAIESFQKIIMEYESLPTKDIVQAPITYPKYNLGDMHEENYRKWCLKNHLFLNPLNELMDMESAFAHDPLTITTYTEDINNADSVSGNTAEPPRWFAMLNQLKEEYVYARFLCYEGMEKNREVHFADKDVKLTLGSYDYTNYSIRIEQLKSAYKNLYSMLDQIGFFINDFWKLGLSERKADACHVCKAQNYPKDNIMLMSLYWVLCEFYERYGDAETEFEKNLALLRNAIEHKFVKVHEYSWERKLQMESDSFYHVSEDDLKQYTIRLLELAREALMYLVYAIGIDERKKDKSENAVHLNISDFSEDWKL